MLGLYYLYSSGIQIKRAQRETWWNKTGYLQYISIGEYIQLSADRQWMAPWQHCFERLVPSPSPAVPLSDHPFLLVWPHNLAHQLPSHLFLIPPNLLKRKRHFKIFNISIFVATFLVIMTLNKLLPPFDEGAGSNWNGNGGDRGSDTGKCAAPGWCTGDSGISWKGTGGSLLFWYQACCWCMHQQMCRSDVWFGGSTGKLLCQLMYGLVHVPSYWIEVYVLYKIQITITPVLLGLLRYCGKLVTNTYWDEYLTTPYIYQP